MILIFGGAYQGKTEYAHEQFGESRTIINDLDREILKWVQADEDVTEKIATLVKRNPDAVFICNDISCGIVPLCPTERKWREAVGRALGDLAGRSEQVIRMYCGIPTILNRCDGRPNTAPTSDIL